MKAHWKWLSSLGSSLLIAANTFASTPAPWNIFQRVSAPPPAPTKPPEQPRQPISLTERLTELSRLMEQHAQSPDLWQLQMEQSEVLLQLAAESQEKEREGMLRMAVDAAYSAAVLCPRQQPIGMQRLRDLPQRLAQAFPGNPVMLYALVQEIQADCTLMLEANGGDRGKCEEHRCQRLMEFAQAYPGRPEALKAVLQAAQIRESLGQTEEAGHCYRQLLEQFPNDPTARKAEGALWRLGANHQPMQLQLPLLYPTSSSLNTFNLDELRGRLTIIYFWTSTNAQVEEDFQHLKRLTDRYAGRGLEVVYVNMDTDPSQGRAFLAGRLTSGTHCYEAGGLESPIAQRYGLQELPRAFVISRDGTLLRHSVPASRLETELAGSVPARR